LQHLFRPPSKKENKTIVSHIFASVPVFDAPAVSQRRNERSAMIRTPAFADGFDW